MPFSKSVLFSRLISFLICNISARWIRLVCLVSFFAIVLSSLPVHLKHDSAIAQGSRPRRTQGPPSRNLPNLDEARGIEPGTPRIMPPVPATKCRGRDEKCKKAKGKGKISNNLPANQDRLPTYAGHPSGRDYSSWLNSRIPALSMLADLFYWPARMISNFPEIPYHDGGDVLAESAVKGANPSGVTHGPAASGGPRKDYGYQSGWSPVAAQSGSSWNLALGKPAMQSSTAADASRAVDGNTNGNFSNNSVSHTADAHQPWWQVDLGSVQQIEVVKLWNRTDCCSERLRDFYVLVSNDPFSSTDLMTTINQAGVSSYYTADPVGLAKEVGVYRSGRYVRVQLAGDNYLHLAEVEVRGGMSDGSCVASVPESHWKGEYFNNTTLTGSPAMVRNDGADFLNFDFGNGGPGCGLAADYFSARWTQSINFAAGTYRFYVTVDNGARLYVDGQPVIDQWAELPPNTYTAEVSFSASGPHEIQLEFFETYGLAGVSLSWAATPWAAEDLNLALIHPENRIGSPGEDLLSRNYNWSLPLLSLPGRAGLDLGLALSLNSLIYTRAGSVMYFDPDQGYPSPGFRLGFPEIRNAFTNTEAGVQSYLLSMPSGRRVEFRQINTNVYEAVDSSHMLLTHDPTNSIFILYTTDGTQCQFMDVTGSGDYKCVRIKDRNGNYITIAYGSLAEIRTVTDTLGRVINFNYDGFNHLLSITQNWGGTTHTWATFAYGTQTIQTNFPGLTLNGTTNGTPESVLMRVGLADGSVYSFEYNTYAQVKTIRRYAPNSFNPVNFPGNYLQLAYTTYGLPDNASGPQMDCPRITSRTDWAHDWNNSNVATSTYDPSGGNAWGKVSFPDGTIYKEFFATTGWRRGLTLQTENWSGGVRKKWTTLEWTQDNTGISYQLNPLVTETNVYDEVGNRRRTTVGHTSFGLPSEIHEYDADATTVLRRTHTDYNLSAAYTDRRIIGLLNERSLYDGNNTLFSKITYEYDHNPNPYLQHQGPPVQHDTANYGPTFVQGRGNLNVVRRWDVTDPGDPDKCALSTIGYNTSGSMIFTHDAAGHRTEISYTDSFSDGQNNRNTYAYPTTMTDPDTFSSFVQYNYDFGAVTRAQDPKGAAVARTYDAAGRLDRITNMVNGAYTRNVYSPEQTFVQSFTTINDLNPANEFYSVTVFDGHGRVRATQSDHPGSVGQYKAQFNLYDVMGRLVGQTNPTEINGSFQPTGDDAAGWAWSYQDYDWKSRPTISTNQDGTTKEISYGGCGCAGGQVMVTRDAVGRRQKIYSDVLGRVIKTEDLLSDGSIYRTARTKYNVRDQIEEVRSIAGSAGVFQIATNEYDGYGRLWRRKLPIEGAGSPGTRFTYNNDDTVSTVTDPRNVVSTYTYNARKLVTGVSFNTGGNPDIAGYGPLGFTYDENGNRLTMTDGVGSTTYHYDTLSRMDWEMRYFNDLSRGYYIYYTYNLAGQLKEIRDHFDDAIYYNLDKAGQVESMTGADLTRGQQFQFTSLQPSSRITYRAWGGLKQMTSGNGVKTNLSYDQAMRIRSFEVTDVRHPENPSQLALAMKTEHEYYGDGRPKYVTDYITREYDRAYKWDHVGRLEVAYTGREATDFAGKPLAGWYGPYLQTYQHDEWDKMTSRVTRFWSQTDTLNTSFTPETGRSPNWSYDAAGNLTQDNSRRYFHDAAGFAWRNQDLTAFPIVVTQSRDGDGNVIKHRLDYHNAPANIARYYLNSTVLGGVPITEIVNLGDGRIIKDLSNIYLGGRRIAVLMDGTWGAHNPPDMWVVWDHVNPVTGSRGKSVEDRFSRYYNRKTELDPMGVNVGFEDPFVDPIPPPDPEADTRGITSILPGGGQTGRACMVDGLPVDCGFAAQLFGSGAITHAPTDTALPVYIFGELVGLATWNGQSPNAKGHEYTYSFWYNNRAVDPATGAPIGLTYLVGMGYVRATPTEYVNIMLGELIGRYGAGGRGSGVDPQSQDRNRRTEEGSFYEAGRMLYGECNDFIERLIQEAAGIATIQYPNGNLGIVPPLQGASTFVLNLYWDAMQDNRVSSSGVSGEREESNRSRFITYGVTTNFRNVSWNDEFYDLGRRDRGRHTLHESLHQVAGFTDQVLAEAARRVTNGPAIGNQNPSEYLNNRIAERCR